jgi:hypothetical protein
MDTQIPATGTNPHQAVYTLEQAAKEAGEKCSYWKIYRAVCNHDLKVLKGFGRLCISHAELHRFLNESQDHVPRPSKRGRPPKKRVAEPVPLSPTATEQGEG